MFKMGNRISELLESTPHAYDYSNGLVLKGYHIPEEIIGEILRKLPPKALLSARLVCKHWKAVISFELHNIYNKKFHSRCTDETLPFDLCYITLFSRRLRGNLLKNVNGQEKFKHWEITQNGGDCIIVEDTPSGSDALPEDVEEFNGHLSCFATSFGSANKRQLIDVATDKYLSHVINKYKPQIYASEWVAPRFDCGAVYRMIVMIEGERNKLVSKEISHREEQWSEGAWIKKEIVIDNYPDNVRKIIFAHSAQDSQYWKGHYGMKMAGAVVKLKLDSIKL